MEKDSSGAGSYLHIKGTARQTFEDQTKENEIKLKFSIVDMLYYFTNYCEIRLKSGKDEFHRKVDPFQFKECYRFILLFKKIFVYFEYTK